MAQRKVAVQQGTRHDLWSKALFKEEVENAPDGASISSICRRWSTDPDKIQGLTNDVIVWRREDEELDRLCLERFGTRTGGRPSKEGEEPDWRRSFCEEYLMTRSRAKATEATPYAYETIVKKLDPNRPEFDQVFYDLYMAAESRLLDNAERIMWEALDQEPSWRNKAWIAKETLRSLDRRRWGDRMDVKVEGSVQHVLQRGKIVGELVDEQRKFLERQRLELTSGDEIVAEVVDDGRDED